MEPQETAQQPGTPQPQPSTLPSFDLPRGNVFRSHGSLIGLGGVAFGLLEIFRSDPKDGIGLFAEFGPKYLLWAFIAYILWDLGKKTLKRIDKASDNLGLMAKNVGDVAVSMNAVATKSDRAAEEMRRLCSFGAQQSERAVEVSLDTQKQSQRTHDLLLQVLAKQGIVPPQEGTSS